VELGRRITKYFLPYRGSLILISLLVILMAGMSALLPVIVSRGVDQLSSNREQQLSWGIISVVLAIGTTRWCANWLRRRLTVRAIAGVILGLAEHAFQSAIDHDLSFHDEYSSGRILSRISSDTRDFGQLIEVITDVSAQFLEAAILAVILFKIEWHLTLYMFSILPFVFILSIFYRKVARKITRRGMQAMADVNAMIKETISGIFIAKNFRQESSLLIDFERANTLSYRVNFRRGLVLSVVFPTLNIIGGAVTALLVYTGGLSVVAGVITAGSWYLFLLSLDSFLYPMLSLSSFFTQVQAGLAAAERVFALIDAPHSIIQAGSEPVEELKGEIEFRNLNLRYREDEPVLEDFNLRILPGESIALVGHTGAGKSSVARLIARFYEYQSGELLIDGKSIRSLNLEEYRKHLGIVTQTPFLFRGTVADNIRYSRPQVTDAEIITYAKKVGNGEWLETLPDGINTQVGERGSLLSMGQRQLVVLLRVLIQQPEIFILDEATASIDPFTEWQIHQALKLILQRSTSILIAHRLSTVKSADRIIVMQQGRIIEQDNHAKLMVKGGHYAELYNTYFRHQSLDYRPAGLNEYLGDKRRAV